MAEYNPELEKALVGARDSIPRLWWALYQGCLATGFNDVQAMALLHTYILGQNPHGIQPDSSVGPPPNDPE